MCVWFHLPLLYIKGNAVIIPSYPPGTDYSALELPVTHNEGKPIKYLISAPTMRVPMDVFDTVNAYLALRAVLRSGMDYFDWLIHLPIQQPSIYTFILFTYPSSNNLFV